MSNYTKTTDFEAKDSLPSGDSGKIIRGSEFETEFDNISTAIATKSDTASPTFTGTVTIPTLSVTGNTTLGNAATDTVTVTADIASNLIPSADDTYNLGASGAEWNDLFIDGTANIDSLVADTADINGGTIDGVTIGGTTAGAITGTTITGSGDMAIDTDTLFVDVSADRVGVNTSSPASALDVNGTVTADGLTVNSNVVGIGTSSPDDVGSRTTLHINHDTNGAAIRLSEGAVNNAFLSYDDSEGFRINSVDTLDLRTNNLDRLGIASNGDISFYEDTGTTPKFFWDASAERLGLGTTSPAALLNTKGDNALLLESTGSDNYGFHVTVDHGTDMAKLGALDSADGSKDGATIAFGDFGRDIRFSTNKGASLAEAMRIDSSGNVGIGTTSPTDPLHVSTGNDSDSGEISIKLGSNASNARAMEITKDTSTPYNTTINTQLNTSTTTGSLIFKNGATEHMRIASGGQLLVGKTAVSTTNTVGHELDSDGHAEHVIDGTTTAHALMLNRKSTDGVLVDFRKDNAAVGSIRVDAGDNIVFTGESGSTKGIYINNTGVHPSGTGGSVSDNAVNLGFNTGRWKDLYLSGGVYLGGIGSANKLDDYEEGTFTPVVADASTGGNTATGTFSGRYTKVGNLVCVQLVLTNINTTGLTAGNQLFVRGLPFTSVGGNFTNSAPYTNNVTFSGYLTSIFGASRTFLYFQDNNSGSGNTNLIVSEINSGVSDIALTTFYEAA